MNETRDFSHSGGMSVVVLLSVRAGGGGGCSVDIVVIWFEGLNDRPDLVVCDCAVKSDTTATKCDVAQSRG